MAQDPNRAPPTAIPPRLQPQRLVRSMTEDELRIADQLVNFPRDARALRDKGEVERRNICRKLAQAIRDGVLQVQHVDTIRQQKAFLGFAEQQLSDANTILAAIAPLTLTDEQLAAVDQSAELLLTRNPEQKSVTLTVRKKVETPAGQMVGSGHDGQAAGGPPQAGGGPAASSVKPSESAQSASPGGPTEPSAGSA